jgi:murein DD-endopeptidase MepM/ murein hydrolase activator NlpD
VRTIAASVAAALALAGLAVSLTARAGEHATAENPGRGEVVSLTDAPVDERTEARPHEDVSADELAAIERDIRARTAPDAAAPDDGIAPGAPSDKEVRRALREVYGGDADPIRRGSGDLIWAVNGPVTSPFGMRWGRLHAGIDIARPSGTPIRAAAAGRVILMAPTGGYGNYACVDHGKGISTCYAHQSRFGTRVGAAVRQGEVIGYVGNTGHSFGAHLHFEVRVNGRPVDPMGYL